MTAITSWRPLRSLVRRDGLIDDLCREFFPLPEIGGDPAGSAPEGTGSAADVTRRPVSVSVEEVDPAQARVKLQKEALETTLPGATDAPSPASTSACAEGIRFRRKP